jgi:hypothetical protein
MLSRRWLWRMPPSGMWRRVARFRTEVSPPSPGWEEPAFLRTMLQLLVTADLVPSTLKCTNLMIEAIICSETSVLTGATHHIPDDGFLRPYRFAPEMRDWERTKLIFNSLQVQLYRVCLPLCSAWGQMEPTKCISIRRVVWKNGVFWDVTPCGSCKKVCISSQRVSVASYG